MNSYIVISSKKVFLTVKRGGLHQAFASTLLVMRLAPMQWYSTLFFVGIPPDVISLQLYTPEDIGV
jgi:hypothetical protein